VEEAKAVNETDARLPRLPAVAPSTRIRLPWAPLPGERAGEGHGVRRGKRLLERKAVYSRRDDEGGLNALSIRNVEITIRVVGKPFLRFFEWIRAGLARNSEGRAS